MQDLMKMGNEELVNLAYGFGAFSSETIRAELLRRLAPSEGIKPNAVEQRHIDIINLRHYARLAEENEWHDETIHWSVFQQTLDAIATRLERLPLPVLSPARSGEPPKQDHCFKCGSFDPATKLSVHAHMLGNRIPGWQNVSDVCSEPYHLAARPSEPSIHTYLPDVPNAGTFISNSAPNIASAPQTSAEHNCPECGRWHSILKQGVSAPPQPMCAMKLCGGWESHPIHHNKAMGNYHPFLAPKPAAPQPVSGDAPEPFDIRDGKNRYKPCIRCGAQLGMGLSTDSSGVFVRCNECSFVGPNGKNDKEAFDLWNALEPDTRSRLKANR